MSSAVLSGFDSAQRCAASVYVYYYPPARTGTD